MRTISADTLKEKVKELFMYASYNIGEDVMEELARYKEEETSSVGKYVLETIENNNKIAAEEKIAICQDTGMAVLFVELGQEVKITGGEYNEIINDGVREAYSDGYLRKSIITDPVFDRKNTGDNTPAVIYTDIVPGDKIKITVVPKGFGSENMSQLAMLSAADGAEGIINAVVDTVKKAGPNPCPPTVIGVGIGGTADRAMVIAKKALTRKLGEHNSDERYAEMEKEMLKRVNNLGIGPAGLGGNTTSLAVNINYLPTHITSMPVAVNICCHAVRHATGVI